MAVLGRHQFHVLDNKGNALLGAMVEVRRETDGASASIFSDRAGTVAKSNPFTVDGDGYGFFHAVGGSYRVRAYLGFVEKEWRYVSVGTNNEFDNASIPNPTIAGNIVLWNSVNGGQQKDSGIPAIAALGMPFNLLDTGGRFSGSPEPQAVYSAAYAVEPWIAAYNGLVITQGHKHTFNTTSFGGAAAADGADAISLLNKIKSNSNGRLYHPEFFVANMAAGAGVAAPITAGGVQHYLNFVNIPAPPTPNYTFNFYVLAKTGTLGFPLPPAVAAPGGSGFYIDGVKQTVAAKIAPDGTWKQITYTLYGAPEGFYEYYSTFAKCYSTPNATFSYALPSVYPNLVDVPGMGQRGYVPSLRAWR